MRESDLPHNRQTVSASGRRPSPRLRRLAGAS
jgi:hypothetical protein